MELYRKRAGKKDQQGVFQYTAPFKNVEVAFYLACQPKFETEYGKSESTAENGQTSTSRNDIAEDGSRSASDLKITRSFSRGASRQMRPVGTKRAKLE